MLKKRTTFYYTRLDNQSRKTLRQRVGAVLAANPTLDIDGWDEHQGDDLKRYRAALLEDYDDKNSTHYDGGLTMVMRCMNWLYFAEPTKKAAYVPYKQDITLWHTFHGWTYASAYLQYGALATAALVMGIPCVPDKEAHSAGFRLGIKKSSIKFMTTDIWNGKLDTEKSPRPRWSVREYTEDEAIAVGLPPAEAYHDGYGGRYSPTDLHRLLPFRNPTHQLG